MTFGLLSSQFVVSDYFKGLAFSESGQERVPGDRRKHMTFGLLSLPSVSGNSLSLIISRVWLSANLDSCRVRALFFFVAALCDFMGGENSHEMITAFIQEYSLPAPANGRCAKCNSARACLNHFCVSCKVGGLCCSEFKKLRGPHWSHPKMQVRKMTEQYVVRADELSKYIGNTRNIQRYIDRGDNVCFLKPRHGMATTYPFSSARRTCAGCKNFIAPSNAPSIITLEEFLVCSLQCLMIYAKDKPELALLKRIDSPGLDLLAAVAELVAEDAAAGPPFLFKGFTPYPKRRRTGSCPRPGLSGN